MSCVVHGCFASTVNGHLFEFPKEEDLKELWFQRVGIDESASARRNRKRLFVCQEHFDPSDYQVIPVKSSKCDMRFILDKNVVPHRNLPSIEDAERYSFMIPRSDPLARPLKIYALQQVTEETEGTEERDNISPERCISPLARPLISPKNVRTPMSILSTPESRTTGVQSSAGSEYLPSYRSEAEFMHEQSMTEDNLKYLLFGHKLMLEKSMKYLGIPEEGGYILKSLQETTNISERDLMIVLRKIRLNETFDILSDCFGLSCSRISQIFDEHVSKIAAEFAELIFWPDEITIKKFLPVAFLQNYSAVQSIIDCFEIQIQKPIDPVAQSVTFSQYKSCNTVKFLVSCAPCDHINFISKGFPGRASDQKIVRNSGFLNNIHRNVGVSADRGFKNVAAEVAQKGGNLIRPPSVIKDEALSKEDALRAKEIASVRIHVERLIRRFREFKMCAPHAELPSYFFHNLDSIVIIVAGLVNLQGPLIK